MNMENIQMRQVEPSDYAPVISVVNEWWGGRNMADMLPKLFFVHFRQTGFIAECDGKVVGFLVGFFSQTLDNEAYIHFVGVHPGLRKRGIGEALYERFFEVVKGFGRNVVRCVTSPVNKGSISFHRRMGFLMEPGTKEIDGVPYTENYDGKNEDRVLFQKTLSA
jgi:ribosomal protein S18 acetylase RimI-like enzyme